MFNENVYSSIYSFLSIHYDEFTQNVDYLRYAEFLNEKLKNTSGKLILDAGCGTANISMLLKEYGYELICVDASEEMLSIADSKSGGGLLLLNQNLEDLDLYGTVNAAISTLDTLNHLDSKSLDKFLARLSLFIEPNGVFIFDLNTEYKHNKILGDNIFVLESENTIILWQNQLLESCDIEIKMDIFSRQPNSLYSRKRGVLKEYYHSAENIGLFLSKHGFKIIEFLDGDSFENLTETSERVIIISEKI
ncbi:MAG: class I SAM-dependent methyltransferase [Ruminococcaceae bacterium]|nr:class I SAM-dependent methyltransferase [Oscillospiraceae bacterium]